MLGMFEEQQGGQCGYNGMQERKDEVRQEVARGHIILDVLGQSGDFGFSSEGIEKDVKFPRRGVTRSDFHF